MSEQKYEHVKHEFEPVYNRDSRILILGTLPSVKSREQNFYYGHKQNRFWKVMAAVCEEPVPSDFNDKKTFLLRNHIAVWDVISECDIIGSSDSSIRNVVPADLNKLLDQTAVQGIFANGATAYKLYMKYSYSLTGRDIIKLPSTSPANAAFSLERLIKEWGQSVSSYLFQTK